jgi:sialate O-acetylesterase
MKTIFNINTTYTLILAVLILLFANTNQVKAMDDNLVLLQSLKGSWLFSIGINEEWTSLKYNDSDWETVRVPSPWEEQGFNGYNGYAFYRKKINISSTYKGRMLYLNMGYIDDVDEVYLNGKKNRIQRRLPSEL